jgi:hypothetical protein
MFAIGSLVSVGALGIYLYQTNSEEDTEDKVKDEPKLEDEVPRLEEDRKTKTRTNRKRQRGITRRRY